jgi:hypothetical protein
MTDTKQQARRKDWQIFKLNSDMHAALEESGGELTPEVEALEARIAENATELAELGASTVKHAKAMQYAVTDEQKRLADIKAYWVRVEALGKRWCRIAAAELGEKIEVGVHTIRLQRAPARAVQVWEALEAEQRDELLKMGLGRLDFSADKRRILAALKAGQDVPGFVLEKHAEKVVVVK